MERRVAPTMGVIHKGLRQIGWKKGGQYHFRAERSLLFIPGLSSRVGMQAADKSAHRTGKPLKVVCLPRTATIRLVDRVVVHRICVSSPF